MKWSKDEIAEELAHQQEMLRLLRRRRRERERQAAQYGLDVPPHIATELGLIDDQIREREADITKLETQFVEDNLSLAEAEYRLQLAEGLDQSNGRLTFVDVARLELARLKLRMQPERAHELENEVRTQLAEETILQLSPDFALTFAEGLEKAKAHVRSNLINELKSPLEIMKMRTKRLFYLEERSTMLGLNTPPEVFIEIDSIRSEIAKASRRVSLSDIVIEENDPLDDMVKKMELIRQEIDMSESEIQFTIDENLIVKHLSESFKKELELLDRAIRLHYDTTVRVLLDSLPEEVGFEVDIFVKTMLRGLDIRRVDSSLFDMFFNNLRKSAKKKSEVLRSE